MPIINFGDIVEESGETIRENNLALPHKFSLGDVVEADVEVFNEDPKTGMKLVLKGRSRLYVVNALRYCDGAPMYTLSDLNVIDETLYMSYAWLLLRSLQKVRINLCEESVTETGFPRAHIFASVHDYLNS